VGAIVHRLEDGTGFFDQLPGIAPWEYLDVAFKDDRFPEAFAEPLKIAKSHIGPVGYEVIQPMGSTSYWAKALASRGDGIHHVAYVFPNRFDAVVEKMLTQGFSPVWEGTTPAGGKTYYLVPQNGGLVVEILQRWPKYWPKSRNTITGETQL